MESFKQAHPPQTVLITGAARGLGLALCLEYASRNAFIFPLVRSEEDCFALLEKFPQQCRPILADLTSVSLEDEIAEALQECGRPLDVLINNAGVGAHGIGLERCAIDELRTLLEVHCVGVIRCIQAALPWLRQSTLPKIVSISSQYGSIEKTREGELAKNGSSYAYRISKAALNMLMACVENEFADEDLRCIMISPAPFRSALGPADASISATETARYITQCIDQ